MALAQGSSHTLRRRVSIDRIEASLKKSSLINLFRVEKIPVVESYVREIKHCNSY